MKWQKVSVVIGAVAILSGAAWLNFGRSAPIQLSAPVPAGANAAGYHNEDAERFLQESKQRQESPRQTQPRDSKT